MSYLIIGRFIDDDLQATHFNSSINGIGCRWKINAREEFLEVEFHIKEFLDSKREWRGTFFLGVDRTSIWNFSGTFITGRIERKINYSKDFVLGQLFRKFPKEHFISNTKACR